MNTLTETVTKTVTEIYCNCKDTMDIRGRCNPTNDPLIWKNCPAKIDSTLWFIENDYESYKQYEQYDCVDSRTKRNDIIIKIAKEKYGLYETEVDDFVKLMDEQVEEMNINTTVVSGIICKKCNVELPPMLMVEHLDINNPKNKMCNCYEKR